MIVHWNQKNRMLKLSIPLCESSDYNYLGQTAYGVNELSADGSEVVAQKWVAAVSKQKNAAVTCINDSVYGSDFSDSCLRLSLLRSPAYAAERIVEGTPRVAHDRFIAHQDQGERSFRFWFNAGKVNQRLESIDRQALAKNERPFALSFYPNGEGKLAKPFAVLSDRSMQIGAIKKMVNQDAYIVRLFEPTGKARQTLLTLPAIGKKFKIRLNKFEIKTLKINLRSRKCREVNLMEK
jgi:alpha-mannosidase